VKNRRSFTLLELLIGLCILSILITISLLGYRYYVNKAKATEAIVAVSQISKAEELLKMQNGTYVAADNTQQVNERLGMNISPKNFEYRVVGISEDNFIVIAQKIGLDISENMVPEPSALIVMDRSGPVTSGYQPYIGGESGVTGGQIIGGSGSDRGGGGSGSGGGGAGGAGGGGSGGGESGGSPTDRRGNANYSPPVYDADPNAAVEKLADLTAVLKDAGGHDLDTGKYYYDLIEEHNISIIEELYEDEDGYTKLGQWDPSSNAIYINSRLRTEPYWSEAAVACVIMHEAVHADFFYNPDKWAARISDQWGIAIGNLEGIELYDTQIQEYFTHSLEAATWLAIKGDYRNPSLDEKAGYYYSGEAAIRNYIAGIPGYAKLPVFYEGEPT
jgi:type II secretory pathway pseudopilin PulG